MPECNCPFHRLSKEERAKLIDAAIDRTNEEVIASGGALPVETILEDLPEDVAEQTRAGHGDLKP